MISTALPRRRRRPPPVLAWLLGVLPLGAALACDTPRRADGLDSERTPGIDKALVGMWGERTRIGGSRYHFGDDHRFEVGFYELFGNAVRLQRTLMGTYWATDGMVILNRKQSTCPSAAAGPLTLGYLVAGDQLTTTLNGKTSVQRRDEVVDFTGLEIITGCFDAMGNFAPGPVKDLE